MRFKPLSRNCAPFHIFPRKRITWDRVYKLHKTAVWMHEHESYVLSLFDLVRYFYTGYGQYGMRLTGGPRCIWRRP